MSAYRLVIADRDNASAAALQAMVEQHPHAACFDIERVTDAVAFQRALSSDRRVDVLIVDLKLGVPAPNGLDLVRASSPAAGGTQVIYTTAHVGFCTSVYETDHVYLLLKPIARADLFAALDKALHNLREERRRSLIIRHNGSVRLVAPERIEFVESAKRKVFVHLGDGEALDAYATLSEVAGNLPDTFVQCHKSFLVNLAYVEAFDAATITLRSGQKVPVSQRLRRSTREALVSYLNARV